MKHTDLTFRAGMTIRAGSGLEELGHPDRASTPFFYHASKGDRLRLSDSAFRFNVATYSPVVDEKYIYTYDYQPNESWTTYSGDLSGETYRSSDYVFAAEVFFRVCIKRVDGAPFEDGERPHNIVALLSAEPGSDPLPKPWLEEEIRRVSERINTLKAEGTLAFALMTDTHYVVNGTWEDTSRAVRGVHALVGFDGIIHLGDLTDGMVTREVTERYGRKCIGDLCANGVPVYLAIGNHDCNYFKGNPEVLSLDEQCRLYLSHADVYTVREPGSPCYYTDLNGLRLISIHSYDPNEQLRYGFSMEHILWLEQTLEGTPDGYKVIIISHLTPLVKLQSWASELRNGDALYEMLERYNARRGNLLAYINGHNHADHIYNEGSFPIISIANAKTEEFHHHKPDGSHTPMRRLGDATQECWDVMLVDIKNGKLDFVRFGAGEGRRV